MISGLESRSLKVGDFFFFIIIFDLSRCLEDGCIEI